jgi:hypothetical protein
MDADPAAKLSPGLTERLDSMAGSSPIEVIVELHPVAVSTSGPRSQRIEAVKAGFERELRPLAEKIAAAGGRVIEAAWINQTVRSSIPAAGLQRVAEDDVVAAIDLPQPLRAEGRHSQGTHGQSPHGEGGPTRTRPTP